MRRIAILSTLTGAVLSCVFLGAKTLSFVPMARAADSSEILIGVSNVQSGPSQTLGQNLLSGSVAYFELVNAQGGIYGRKISILLKDDRYEPDPAVQNTNELIQKENTFF